MPVDGTVRMNEAQNIVEIESDSSTQMIVTIQRLGRTSLRSPEIYIDVWANRFDLSKGDKCVASFHIDETDLLDGLRELGVI